MIVSISPFKAQTIVPAANPASTIIGNTGSGFTTHLSCDGLTYNAGANTMKVFAWDGNGLFNSQGFFFDAGAGAQIIKLGGTPNTVIFKPEIALVSKDYGLGGVAIFAVIVYYVSTAGGNYEAYMDVQQWNGTMFTSYNYVAIPNSITPIPETINVAGDEYGHFVIVYGKGHGDYSEKSIKQWAGYFKNSTTILMGTAGSITRNNYDMSEPDADVTYDNTVNNAPVDGNVFLTFVTKLGYTIMAAGIQFNDLFNGGTWDIMSNNNDLAEVPNLCITSHPSVSVNDGFLAYPAGIVPHASVAYQDECTFANPGTESIYLFGINRFSYALSSTLLPLPVIPGIWNRQPTVVTSPIDNFAVTTWNYTGPSSVYEGLAHTATYDLPSNSFDPTFSGDMQVQFGGGSTYLTTASGFSSTEMLYFYFENTFNSLEYKTRPYASTALRKTENETTNVLSVYPNPVNSSISITSKDNLKSTLLTDATGRIAKSIEGNGKALENALNKNLGTLPAGLYFLKSTTEDGNTSTVKFLKQ